MKNLKDRTKEFAFDCIDLVEKLQNTKLGNHIHGQLIRSSTSVAANYRAASHGLSKAAFIAKLSIVLEEADESEFWLEVIQKKLLTNDGNVVKLKREAHELTSIFVQARKTAQLRKNIRN